MHLNCKQKLLLYFLHSKFKKIFIDEFVIFVFKRSKQTKNHTVDWLFKNIQNLGYVFDFNTELYDQYIIFQDLLDIIDVNNQTRLYDTQDKFEFKVNSV